MMANRRFKQWILLNLFVFFVEINLFHTYEQKSLIRSNQINSASLLSPTSSSLSSLNNDKYNDKRSNNEKPSNTNENDPITGRAHHYKLDRKLSINYNSNNNNHSISSNGDKESSLSSHDVTATSLPNSSSGSSSANTSRDSTRTTGSQGGVSMLYAAVASVIFMTIILMTLIGNTLVILAVVIVRKLHTQDNANNFLIVSLAVSDLLVGVFAMPFAFYIELSEDNKWNLGAIVCDLYILSDVLLCTASILNLCAISIDRYFIILHAFAYTQRRNAKLMLTMILVVWLLSALISIPPLLGWGKPSARVALDGTCAYSSDLKYQIYATLCAFYLPLAVMIIIYINIYRAANKIRKREMETAGHLSAQPSSLLIVNGSDKQITQMKKASHNSDSDQGSIESKVYHSSSSQDSNNHNHAHSVHHQIKADSTLHPPDPQQFHTSSSHHHHQQHYLLASATQQQTGAGPRHSSINRFGRRLTQAFAGLHAAATGQSHLQRHSGASIAHGKNQKATKTLGVIMGCFILCWLPFFILAILRPFPLKAGGQVGDYIPRWLDSILLWLGYFNSALNPMIYARYNREFRRPFLEILCFRCRGINDKLRDEERRKMYLDASSVHHSSFFNQRNSTSHTNPVTPGVLSSLAFSSTAASGMPAMGIQRRSLNREVLSEEESTAAAVAAAAAATCSATAAAAAAAAATSGDDSEDVTASNGKKKVSASESASSSERKRILEIERSRFYFGTEKPPYVTKESLETVENDLHAFAERIRASPTNNQHRPSNDETLKPTQSFDIDELTGSAPPRLEEKKENENNTSSSAASATLNNPGVFSNNNNNDVSNKRNDNKLNQNGDCNNSSNSNNITSNNTNCNSTKNANSSSSNSSSGGCGGANNNANENNNDSNNLIQNSFSFSNQSSDFHTPQTNTPVNDFYSVDGDTSSEHTNEQQQTGGQDGLATEQQPVKQQPKSKSNESSSSPSSTCKKSSTKCSLDKNSTSTTNSSSAATNYDSTNSIFAQIDQSITSIAAAHFYNSNGNRFRRSCNNNSDVNKSSATSSPIVTNSVKMTTNATTGKIVPLRKAIAANNIETNGGAGKNSMASSSEVSFYSFRTAPTSPILSGPRGTGSALTNGDDQSSVSSHHSRDIVTTTTNSNSANDDDELVFRPMINGFAEDDEEEEEEEEEKEREKEVGSSSRVSFKSSREDETTAISRKSSQTWKQRKLANNNYNNEGELARGGSVKHSPSIHSVGSSASSSLRRKTNPPSQLAYCTNVMAVKNKLQFFAKLNNNTDQQQQLNSDNSNNPNTNNKPDNDILLCSTNAVVNNKSNNVSNTNTVNESAAASQTPSASETSV